MTQRHMPREFYLKRAVECYDHMGDQRAAADVLARFGSPAASADAAQRYVALGDLPAAGEAYLAADQPRAALDCFQRARLPERVLACLHVLDDPAAAGALLLELGRLAEAAPLLDRALAAATRPADQVMLRFQLAQALGLNHGETHYRAALAEVAHLPATDASAEAWVALGAWGAAVGRQDRMQEGYAHALRLLDHPHHLPRWRAVATRYQTAAQAIGNRRLVQILATALADRVEPPPPTEPPPDPAQLLLDSGQWEAALAALEPRARVGDDPAKRLLATLVEGKRLPSPAQGEGLGVRASEDPRSDSLSRRERAGVRASIPPLPLRLKTAALLGEVGDPRLLNVQTGDAPLGGYWCPIDAGPFWYGPYDESNREDTSEERNRPLRQVTLPYTYRVGRYPVTNAEYRRFVEAGGYQQQQWWTANGWAYLQPGSRRWDESNETRITLPRYWDNAERNQPTQPVVGVSWYEAVAYCAWLTAQGQTAGWLANGDVIRLPTSLEWERAARGIDQRRYPWGNEPPDTERANFKDTGIGRPTPVGCFPAGAADCGALDLAGNVMEWMSTPMNDRDRVEPQKDFTPSEGIVLSWSMFDNRTEQLCCGARSRYNPSNRYFNWSFRCFSSRALLE